MSIAVGRRYPCGLETTPDTVKCSAGFSRAIQSSGIPGRPLVPGRERTVGREGGFNGTKIKLSSGPYDELRIIARMDRRPGM